VERLLNTNKVLSQLKPFLTFYKGEGGPMLQRTMIAVALLTCIGLPGAYAETQEERLACQNDAQTLCPDEIPDRAKVYACLVRKVNQLNPACKKIINASLTPSRPRK
jgi:hypothetical protein